MVPDGNPVRAEMVRSPLEWPWSSYRAMVGHPQHLAALRTGWLLSAFSERRAEAVERYKAFVADGGNQPSPWDSLKNQIYLGSDSFVEDIQQHITDEDRLSEIPSSQRRVPAKPLDHYVTISATRNEAIRLAYASGGYSLKQIGRFFGLCSSPALVDTFS